MRPSAALRSARKPSAGPIPPPTGSAQRRTSSISASLGNATVDRRLRATRGSRVPVAVAHAAYSKTLAQHPAPGLSGPRSHPSAPQLPVGPDKSRRVTLPRTTRQGRWIYYPSGARARRARAPKRRHRRALRRRAGGQAESRRARQARGRRWSPAACLGSWWQGGFYETRDRGPAARASCDRMLTRKSR